MLLPLRVRECHRAALPVDPWVVLREPIHSEDGVVALDRAAREIEAIGVRPNPDLGGRNIAPRVLQRAVGEAYAVGMCELLGGKPVPLHELLGGEATVSSAVHQDVCCL